MNGLAVVGVGLGALGLGLFALGGASAPANRAGRTSNDTPNGSNDTPNGSGRSGWTRPNGSDNPGSPAPGARVPEGGSPNLLLDYLRAKTLVAVLEADPNTSSIDRSRARARLAALTAASATVAAQGDGLYPTVVRYLHLQNQTVKGGTDQEKQTAAKALAALVRSNPALPRYAVVVSAVRRERGWAYGRTRFGASPRSTWTGARRVRPPDPTEPGQDQNGEREERAVYGADNPLPETLFQAIRQAARGSREGVRYGAGADPDVQRWVRPEQQSAAPYGQRPTLAPYVSENLIRGSSREGHRGAKPGFRYGKAEFEAGGARMSMETEDDLLGALTILTALGLVLCAR